mgnify:CR=1 FL=1
MKKKTIYMYTMWGDFLEIPNNRECVRTWWDYLGQQLMRSYVAPRGIRKQLKHEKRIHLAWVISKTSEYPLPTGTRNW